MGNPAELESEVASAAMRSDDDQVRRGRAPNQYLCGRSLHRRRVQPDRRVILYGRGHRLVDQGRRTFLVVQVLTGSTPGVGTVVRGTAPSPYGIQFAAPRPGLTESKPNRRRSTLRFPYAQKDPPVPAFDACLVTAYDDDGTRGPRGHGQTDRAEQKAGEPATASIPGDQRLGVVALVQ